VPAVQREINWVLDNNGNIIGYYAPGTTSPILSFPTALGVLYYPPFAGSGARTVNAKFSDIVSVGDFTPNKDGVTDDSFAFQAAANYAGALAFVAAGQNVNIIVPPGKYRIANSIIQPAHVGWIGYGASLIGPITAYPRITGATVVPAANDVAGQCGGACFTDAPSNNTLYYVRWEGLDFQGFRWGLVSQSFAWYEPQIVNCNFSNCDGMAMSYQGAQSWNFIDPIINNCYVGYIGSATCFAAGNAYTGNDNYFSDNIKISGRRANPYIVANTNFDTWFQAAILRPTTASIVITGNIGNYVLSATPTACSPSSRLVYIPQRNNRTTFNTGIKDIIMFGSARGCCFISRPVQIELDTIVGEGCFLDPVINAAGTTETMVTLTDSTIEIYGELHNIDAIYSAIGGVTGGSVNVLLTGTGIGFGTLHASSLYGTVMTPQFFASSLANNIGSTENQAWLSSISGLDLPSKGQASVASQGGDYVYFLAGASHRQKEYAYGATLPRIFAAGKLPGVAGTETISYIVWSGSISPDLFYFPVQGTLRVWAREMDTGAQDLGEFLVTLGGRNSSTTVVGALASGAMVVPIAVSQVGIGAGAVIRINNADNYVVKSVSGLNVTLCTPTRNNYANGNAVATTFSVDRTLLAFTNGIVTVTANTGASAIAITSSLGTTVPVEWRAEFTSHGPPI
jgi:hypothetical protein